MKGLSFRQPWGWAITYVEGAIAKRIENRTWRTLKGGLPPVNMPLDTDFAIHVSATKPYDDDYDGVLAGIGAPDPFNPPPTFDLRSAIIGVAQIAMVLRCVGAMTIVDGTEDKPFPHYVINPSDRDKFLYDLRLPLTTAERHDQLRRWWLGPYAFVLWNVRKLREPILEVKGALNFWDVKPEHEARIKELL